MSVNVYGTRLFGKVDEVPGFFYVATKFWHLNYLPLVPLQTFAIFSKTGDAFSGFPLKMSGKSILIAWTRFLSGVAALLGAFMIVFAVQDNRLGAWQLATCGAGVAIYALSKLPFVTRAKMERALQISHACGFSDERRQLLQTFCENRDRS